MTRKVSRGSSVAKAVPRQQIEPPLPSAGETVAVLELALKRSNLKSVFAGPPGQGQIIMSRAGVEQLVSRLTRLATALEWYAESMGASKSRDMRIICEDAGRRAREALR